MENHESRHSNVPSLPLRMEKERKKSFSRQEKGEKRGIKQSCPWESAILGVKVNACDLELRCGGIIRFTIQFDFCGDS